MITASLNPAALTGTLPVQASPAAPSQTSGASFERELQRAADAAPRARGEDTAHADAQREATRQADSRKQAERRSSEEAQARSSDSTDSKPGTETAEVAEAADPTVQAGDTKATHAELADDTTPGDVTTVTPDLSAFVASLGVRPDATTQTQLRLGSAAQGTEPAQEVREGVSEIRGGKASQARVRSETTEMQTKPDVTPSTARVATAEFQAVLRAAAPVQAETTLKGPALELAAGNPAAALALATGGAAALAAHTAARPAEATLAPAVGSREFAQALGAQLTTFAQDGIEHARLKVHPADLGPITLKLTMEGTHVRVDFAADAGATRQALEQALPSLAGALREAGLTLSGGGVFQQSHQGANDGGAGKGGSGSAGPDDGAIHDLDDTMPLRSRTVRLDGLIDLYA